MTRTPASRQIRSFSPGGKARTKLTPKGRWVEASVSASLRSNSSGLSQVTASMPSPPAAETAAARAGVAARPIGAWISGVRRPSNAVNRVSITVAASGSGVDDGNGIDLDQPLGVEQLADHH